jgi:hypothetical protein
VVCLFLFSKKPVKVIEHVLYVHAYFAIRGRYRLFRYFQQYLRYIVAVGFIGSNSQLQW